LINVVFSLLLCISLFICIYGIYGTTVYMVYMFLNKVVNFKKLWNINNMRRYSAWR
jgi:hypothetical protein